MRFQPVQCPETSLGERWDIADTVQDRYARFLPGVGQARLHRIADWMNHNPDHTDIYEWHQHKEAP